MAMFKPVSIPRSAFNFCKWSVAGMIWIALILQTTWLLYLVLFILASSALLKISRAPLVFIYQHTINRLHPSQAVILDEKAMRFAHTLGATLALVSIILIAFNPFLGWSFVFFFALAKTAGALGWCAAQKLYGCITNGSTKTCCKVFKKTNGNPVYPGN